MITDRPYSDLLKKLRSLPRTGQEPGESESDLTSLSNQYEGAADSILKFKNVLKDLQTDSAILQSGLSATTAVLRKYNESIVHLVKDATYFNEIEKSIAKTLGITTKQSLELSKSTDQYISKLNITRKQLDQYRSTFEGILPGQAKQIGFIKQLSQEQIKQGQVLTDEEQNLNAYKQTLFESQQVLQDYLEMSPDAAQAYLLYTEGSNKSIAAQLSATQELADTWDEATGQVGSFKYIMDSLTKLSAATRSEFGRIPGNLERAILKTKHLGISMETLSQVGTNLLNIEQSVGKEIEFQLITGKRLVDAQGRSLTNRIREAKVLGDGVKMAEAMNDLVEQHGEILRTGSFMQKQALADSVGMQVEDLILAEKKLTLTKKIAASQNKSYEDFIKLTPEKQQEMQAAFEKKLSTVKGGEIELKEIQSLKKQEIDLKTPADRTALFLEKIVDEGIAIKKISAPIATFDSAKFAQTIAKEPTYQLGFNETFIKQVGLASSALNVATTSIKNFSELLSAVPVKISNVGEKIGVSIYNSALDKLKELKFGGVSLLGTPIQTNTVTSTAPAGVPEKDAIIINDGLVIRPHPSDKIQPVKQKSGNSNNITVLGTSVAGNSKLADALGSGMDTTKLVQAIQTAFAGVNISVNIDPMQIDREIKFRTATINV